MSFTRGTLVVIVCTTFIVHLLFIHHRPVVDETIWLEHSKTFAAAVRDQQWSRTRTTTRPGVTVQWVIAAVTAAGGHVIAVRTVFAGITVVSAVATYLILQRIINKKIAAAAAFLIPLQPLLVANSVAWTDLVLCWLLLITVLLFVALPTFTPRQREYVTIGLGFLFGLTILTKIIGWLLPLMLLSTFVAEKQWRPALQKNMLSLAVIFTIGILVSFLLYPAAWSNPFLLIDRTSEVAVTAHPGASITSAATSYIGRLFSYDPVLFILSNISIATVILLAIRDGGNARPLVRFFAPAAVYTTALLSIATLSDSQVEQILSARYLVPITPLLLIGSLQVLRRSEQYVHAPLVTLSILLLFTSYVLLSATSFVAAALP